MNWGSRLKRSNTEERDGQLSVFGAIMGGIYNGYVRIG